MENNFENDLHTDPKNTWLNPSIRSLKLLKDWILLKLGAPLITVELTDEQLNSCIGDAIAVYSKYAYFPEKYLCVNLAKYTPTVGIDLHEFHIMSVKDIAFQRDRVFGMYNDSFFSPYTFFGQGPGSPMFGLGNGNWTGSWVSYHNLHEFFDLTKRMLGSQPDWQWDKTTQILKLFPEPTCNHKNHMILLTVNQEPPIEEFYANEYVRRLCLAECKILLGTIRKTFSSIQLVGGGQIDTTIGDEGKEEKQQIMENLLRDEAKGQCWMIV